MNNTVTKLTVLVVHAAVAFSLVGSAQTTKVPVTGFFTSMRYVAEAGDVVGMEVWIVYARGGYWATVQLAEGEPEVPVVVPVEVSDRKVIFSLPATANALSGKTRNAGLRFTGEVNSVGIRGSLSGQRVTLKRAGSYWR